MIKIDIQGEAKEMMIESLRKEAQADVLKLFEDKRTAKANLVAAKKHLDVLVEAIRNRKEQFTTDVAALDD